MTAATARAGVLSPDVLPVDAVSRTWGPLKEGTAPPSKSADAALMARPHHREHRPLRVRHRGDTAVRGVPGRFEDVAAQVEQRRTRETSTSATSKYVIQWGPRSRGRALPTPWMPATGRPSMCRVM
jgi:hypothetical protein